MGIIKGRQGKERELKTYCGKSWCHKHTYIQRKYNGNQITTKIVTRVMIMKIMIIKYIDSFSGDKNSNNKCNNYIRITLTTTKMVTIS